MIEPDTPELNEPSGSEKKTEGDQSASKSEAKLREVHDSLTVEEKERICVNLRTDECDEREIQLEPLNEKFFLCVLKSLLFSHNPRIVYRILDIVNFYVKHETPF